MNDEFGDRMKGYEKCLSAILPQRVPIIMRLDGRAFHTFTRKADFNRPFDENLHRAMVNTTIALCEDIQNVRLGYTQSDEISLLIYPKRTNSQPWLGNKIQKMASVSAGVASVNFYVWVRNYIQEGLLPSFDSRVFVLPVFEVRNYFWWRQADAIRNSVSMLARAHFSPKELHQQNVSQMKQMLLEEKGISWDGLKPWAKQGTVVSKTQGFLGRSRWVSDPAPNFLADSNYFNGHLTEPSFIED